MRLRIMVGTVLNIVGIAAPVTWLYIAYGPSARVDVASTDDMAVLVGTAVVGYVVGLCASTVSYPKTPSALDAFTDVVRGFRATNKRQRPGTIASRPA